MLVLTDKYLVLFFYTVKLSNLYKIPAEDLRSFDWLVLLNQVYLCMGDNRLSRLTDCETMDCQDCRIVVVWLEWNKILIKWEWISISRQSPMQKQSLVWRYLAWVHLYHQDNKVEPFKSWVLLHWNFDKEYIFNEGYTRVIFDRGI